MKKLTYLVAGCAMALGMVSCSQDALLTENGQEGNVVFKVTRPGKINTRAFGDGKSAFQLDYAVYEADSEELVTTGEATFEDGSLETTIALTLGNGKNYKIAFLAHLSKADQAYVLDAANKTLKVNYDKMTDYNATDNDAFFKLHETGIVKGVVNQPVKLTRPMAQVNWGSSDLNTDAVLTMYSDGNGKNTNGLQSTVVVKGVYDSYNFWTKTFGDEVNVTFPTATRPDSSKETFPYQPGTYNYVSMNYVLVPADEQTLVEAILTPLDKANVAYPQVVVASCPIQANYQTNIYGSLLTSVNEFNVEKVPAFDGNEDWPAVPGQEPTPEQPSYHITLPTDWSNSWVYTAEAEGKPVAQITKEYLSLPGTLRAQAIVVYPINEDGEVLLTQGGYVAEILLQCDDTTVDPKVSHEYTAPTGNVHGGTVKFLLNAYNDDLKANAEGNGAASSTSTVIPTLNSTAHFTYTAGTSAAASEVWMLNNKITVTPATEVIETTVKPYLVVDNRGDDDNYTYGVVKIGCQYWLNSNLKAAHWNKSKNFEAIPTVGEGWTTKTYASRITAFDSAYDNDAKDVSTLNGLNAEGRDLYGVLYNYLAIGGYPAVDDSGVADAGDNIDDKVSPEGWIVPTLPECLTMGAYTAGIEACGRLQLSPLTTENNITGFNGRRAYYFYGSRFAFGSSFDTQYLTRTYAGSNACFWTANTTTMTMTKNRGSLERLNLIRCINNGAIKVK